MKHFVLLLWIRSNRIQVFFFFFFMQTNYLCARHLTKKVSPLLTAAILVRTSPPDTPQGKLDGKFQNIYI